MITRDLLLQQLHEAEEQLAQQQALVETLRTRLNSISSADTSTPAPVGSVSESSKTSHLSIFDNQYFNLIIRQAPISIAMFDTHMNYLAVNEKWLEECGLQGQNIIGQNHYDVFPDMRDDWKEFHRRGLNGETIKQSEDRFERPDGIGLWSKWEIKPWHDAQGNIGGIFIFGDDISRLKQNEELVLLQGAALQAVANAVVITDRDGIIKWCNPAFSKLTGYSAEEAIGRNPRELVKSDVHDSQFFKGLWDTILAGKVWHGQLTNRRKDKTLYDEEQTITPLQDENGEIKHFIAVKEDITLRKQGEAALLDYTQYLEAMHQIVLDLLNRREIDDLLQASVELASVILDAPFAELLLEENGELVVHAFTMNQPFLKGDRVDRSNGLLSWQAFDSGKPAIIEDYSAWAKHRPIYDAAHLHSVADLPIMAGRECLGVLALGRSAPNHPFTERDIQKGMMFSQIVAVVLDNVKLYNNALQEIAERKKAQAELSESENRFKGAFEYSPIGMALVSPEGRWLKVNNSITQILGYSPEEFAYIDFQKITYPEDLDLDIGLVNRALRGEIDSYSIEKRYVHKDGHVVWALLGVSLVRDELQQPLYFISQVEDISQRKVSELSLRETNQRLQLVLEGASLATWDWNINTDEIDFDQNWSNILLDLPDTKLRLTLGSWRDLIHPLDDARVVETINKQKLDPDPQFQLEFRLRTLSVHARWILVSGRVSSWDQDNKPARALGIIMDITARKKAEQQAFELALEKERVMLLTQFIQDASHEFRTPLTVIQSALYILNKMSLDEKSQRKINQIDEQIVRITELVDRLVEMSALDNGVAFDLRDTNLTYILDLLNQRFRAKLESRQQVLQVSVPLQLPLVKADSERLFAALYHVLDNAIRYTVDGGIIHLSAEQEHDQVMIRVQDSGPGIPTDVLPHIFKRFYRSDIAHSSPGIGLGLPIAKAIIERHGGTIEVLSTSEAGTCIQIQLPLGNNA